MKQLKKYPYLMTDSLAIISIIVSIILVFAINTTAQDTTTDPWYDTH